jgi:transposase-like protein
MECPYCNSLLTMMVSVPKDTELSKYRCRDCGYEFWVIKNEIIGE